MLPTPSTSHVNYDRIYEPAEDSYLLLDILSSTSETAFLKNHFLRGSPPPLALEVGPGSGVVLAFVTAHAQVIFGRDDVFGLGVDVNEYACAATEQTVAVAAKEVRQAGSNPGLFLSAVCGDLTASLKPGSVDVLIFNPPYVPSEAIPSSYLSASDQNEFDRNMHLSLLATDGGADGMEVTNRLLEQLPDILSRRGMAYILFCAQNKPDDVMARVREWPADGGPAWLVHKVGWSGKKAGWEKLCVIRIWRPE